MSARTKVALSYAAAVLIPLILAAGWDDFPPILQDLPTVLFLLLAALIARFLGFGPALVFSVVSGGVLWFHLLRFVSTEPLPVLLRLVLYLAASITIASISRQRSEEVREAEERYRSLVELAPDAIGVSDDKGQILFVNSAMIRLVGAADASELIGRNTFDLVHPEYKAVIGKRRADLASGKEAPWMEVKWVRLDGSPIDVETAGVPVRKEGRLLFQGFARDLTERKKAEARIEEGRLRMQALFDTALDAILFLDSSGQYIEANPAASELLGFTHEEILTMKFGDFTPPEEQERLAKSRNDIVQFGHSSGELTILRKDGTRREIEYRTVANVLPEYHATFMHDITGRKEAERSLRKLSGRLLRLQDEERRRIARQLHDTTAQSLAALRMNLSVIKRSPAASDHAIKEAVDESIALSDQSIAEIRALSYQLHPPFIDEAGLLTSLRWYVRGFERRSGITVTVDAPDDLERFPGDLETAVFRIIQEALTNIQRHSGSAIAHIRLEKQAEGIRLEIEDEGRGMPEDLRADEGALASAGVGIAAMQQRVTELGGRLQIQSQDRGTRIIVTFPLIQS
ncbi:MAG: PAS domain S-box protein [Acidobacteriota bacterium]